jgi:serine/threonine-protein kinase
MEDVVSIFREDKNLYIITLNEIQQYNIGKLAKGEKCRVRLKVSLGEKREILPNLAGFHYIEAANVLRELGISVRVVPIFGEGGERDRVLRASPEFGQSVKSGDTVTLFVSRERVKGSVRVGDYAGLEKEEAVSRILSDGLTVSEIVIEYSEKYAVGTVIRQSIKSGASVPYGSEISLTVCGGKDRSSLRFWFRWGGKS